MDTEADCEEAFKVFDKEGKGQLSVAEVRELFTRSGEKLSSEEVDALIASADADGSGFIDLAEFKGMM